MNVLDTAIAIVGAQKLGADARFAQMLTVFAKELGVTRQAVQKWRQGKVPAERCREIQLLTAGGVTCNGLRPDVFGEPASEPLARVG